MSRSRKRPYTGSKRFDASCRSHGGCPWCERNRQHAARKGAEAADAQIMEATVHSTGRFRSLSEWERAVEEGI